MNGSNAPRPSRRRIPAAAGRDRVAAAALGRVALWLMSLVPLSATAAVPALSSSNGPELKAGADHTALFRRAAENGEKTWAAALEPEKYNPGMSAFFTYALALCEAQMHPERLEKLMARAYQLQVRDPQSPSYGSFRWNWNDTTVVDANAIEFNMQPAAILWLRHRDTMPAAAREKLHGILEPAAVTASLNHHVKPSYTNIALMSAGNLIMLGEGLNRPEIADEGYKRLQDIFDLTARSGIVEFNSPTYYGVDLNALQLMNAFIQRPSGQRQARALLEYIWTEVAANYSWANQRLCGPHSRTYDFLHGLGGLDSHLAAAGFLESAGDGGLMPAFARWQPTPELVAMSRTNLPRLVRRRSYTHWLAKDVTLGTAMAGFSIEGSALTVDFAGSRDDVRCYFIPDGRHDPYGKVKFAYRGHDKSLHLAPFFAGVQESQDSLALIVYRDADVPAESKTLESHFVMPRNVDAIYVGEQKVEFLPGAPRSVAVKSGEPVFLRKGTAAIGVRAPAARTLEGKSAPAALVWDGNEWDAIRFTVDHEKSERPAKTTAAVIIQVRVGSELDAAAFAGFRRAFAATKCDMAFEGDKISVRAPTFNPGKTMFISNEAPWAAPWNKPTRLEPAPSAASLEINGEDIGRKLFDAGR